jgi:PDZ domain-containing protein
LLVVAMLVLVTIAVAALLPARLVASKDVTDADGATHDEPTPYALVPAAAQPVAGRVSYDDVASSALAGVDIDTHPDGRVYFVTVSEPAQSLLGRFVGLPEPEVDWLTYEDKYGSSTPSQQRTLNLQLMRTSSQVAQYVALSRAGFTEAQVVPGPVQIEQGTADATVLPLFTDQLDKELIANGVKLTYKKYPGVDHGGVVVQPKPQGDAYKWVSKRLG